MYIGEYHTLQFTISLFFSRSKGNFSLAQFFQELNKMILAGLIVIEWSDRLYSENWILIFIADYFGVLHRMIFNV